MMVSALKKFPSLEFYGGCLLLSENTAVFTFCIEALKVVKDRKTLRKSKTMKWISFFIILTYAAFRIALFPIVFISSLLDMILCIRTIYMTSALFIASSSFGLCYLTYLGAPRILRKSLAVVLYREDMTD